MRIGIMGFGHIGRHLYRLAVESGDFEIPVINDCADPGILHYLLTHDRRNPTNADLDGNYLINDKFRSRMLTGDDPRAVPWDLFEVDFVVDCTGRLNGRDQMQQHLDCGARRVLLSMLPADTIDRIVLPGINEASASTDDKLISAGSSTTNALAIVLKTLDEKLGVANANMVTLHAYTSDQSLQDHAGKDFRRSRSAAENIIPNQNASAACVAQLLPKFKDKLCGSALNVPVQKGSLLDLNLVMEDPACTEEDVNRALRQGADEHPHLLGVVDDPIVSSDIIGNRVSALCDTQATLKAGSRIVKTLSWYDNGLSQACRMLDVLNLYREMDSKGGQP
ncbi:MAG: type I glyceraldehyde-3-phosphate dehydrogenase [bacterium]